MSYTFTFDKDATTAILEGLSELPYKRVNVLIGGIVNEAHKQEAEATTLVPVDHDGLPLSKDGPTAQDVLSEVDRDTAVAVIDFSDVEQHLKHFVEREASQRGDVYPALFEGAFARLGPFTVKFVTMCSQGPKGEMESLVWVQGLNPAVEMFKAEVVKYFDLVNATLSLDSAPYLYWRNYPTIERSELVAGQYTVRARFAYCDPVPRLINADTPSDIERQQENDHGQDTGPEHEERPPAQTDGG